MKKFLFFTLFATVLISCGKKNSTMGSNDPVMDNILTRTSIRSYTDQPVEDTKIEKMLRAAMAAPTAVNKQPWHFIVVTSKEVLKSLSETNPHGGMIAKAPLAIVVCGDMNKALEGNGRDFWIQDCSAASENLLLAAHSMGLGAVWTAVYPDSERIASVSKVLELPSTLIPLNTIVIGYPAETPQPKDKWNEANITYKK
ncbi:MAG: nitroreductase family protein [Prevotella sp.]|nr:nitroreductase family protein [Prevotella sp.]